MSDDYESPDSKQWDAAREVWALVGITVSERPEEDSHHYLGALRRVVASFKEARSVSKLDRERDWSFVDLADRCSDLNDVLSEVDDVAFARIARASPTYADQLLPETIVNLELLEAALRITTSPKVPRKKHHEHNNFLTVALADVYESISKKNASVTTDPITDERKGPFVDFVVRFAEHFLPDESLDLNGRAIQRALKTRRDNPDPLG